MEQKKENPRWVNDIPGIKDNVEKKINNKRKKDVKEFRNAIKNDNIDEWFNKNK